MMFRFRHDRPTAATQASGDTLTHRVTSDYSEALCRFTLTCRCGEHFDTPYIDEALEIRELHEQLAPLMDQLAR